MDLPHGIHRVGRILRAAIIWLLGIYLRPTKGRRLASLRALPRPHTFGRLGDVRVVIIRCQAGEDSYFRENTFD